MEEEEEAAAAAAAAATQSGVRMNTHHPWEVEGVVGAIQDACGLSHDAMTFWWVSR